MGDKNHRKTLSLHCETVALEIVGLLKTNWSNLVAIHQIIKVQFTP